VTNKCMLICEDDEGIIDLAQVVIEDMGHRAIAEMNSSKVYTTIEKVKPDLVLLDIWMPGLTGDEIVSYLKANESTRHIPIIIMSASKDTEKVAREVGADAFLTKPFEIGTLESIVEKYLAQ
jgi:two-component system, OmpR family, alkaline phosphatase synthesis response regulator PhoP